MSTGTETTAAAEGLRGVVAAQSAIGDVNGEQGILIYQGYDIHDLAEHSTFEEVVFLLWNGRLPNAGRTCGSKGRDSVELRGSDGSDGDDEAVSKGRRSDGRAANRCFVARFLRSKKATAPTASPR